MRVRGRKSYQPVVPDPFLGPQLPSSWEVGFFQQMSQILLLALMAFGVSQREDRILDIIHMRILLVLAHHCANPMLLYMSNTDHIIDTIGGF